MKRPVLKKTALKKPIPKKPASKIRGNIKQELEAQLQRRQSRFRMLVCVNGEDSALESVNLAARIGRQEESDIVLLYVRRIDQGLNAGGLQVRVARRNLLEWGLELPGIKYLKQGFDILVERGFLGNEWDELISHTDVFGDPLGDNKVDYRGKNGHRIVLKLKTARDVPSGILHQYELGPYNMILMGPSIQWNASWRSLFEPNTVQKVAGLAPATVMTVRGPCVGNGFLLSTDGSAHSLSAKRAGAVLAHSLGEPVTILGTAEDDSSLKELETKLADFRKGLEEDGIEVDGCSMVIGDPVRSTIEAGNRYSAIVVSDRQTSRLSRFFKGSIAFDIMRLATTSVINIR